MQNQVRVAITGGSGYTGSALSLALAEFCDLVTVIDKSDLAPAQVERGSIQFFRGDICDPRLLHRALSGHDVIVHLAFTQMSDESESSAVNVETLPRLLKAAQEVGINRLLFPSSCSIYGSAPSSAVCDETATVSPLSSYARYKVKCEEIIRSHEWSDFDRYIFRPATVAGRSPKQRLDLLLNRIVNSAVTGTSISENFSAMRPILSIRSLVEAYARVIKEPYKGGHLGAYNLCDDQRTIDDWVVFVEHLVGVRVKRHSKGVADGRSYRISCDAYAREFGPCLDPRRLTEAVRDLVSDLTDVRVPVRSE